MLTLVSTSACKIKEVWLHYNLKPRKCSSKELLLLRTRKKPWILSFPLKKPQRPNEFKTNFIPVAVKDQWLLLRQIFFFFFFFFNQYFKSTGLLSSQTYLKYLNLINFKLLFHYFNPAIVSCILVLVFPTLPLYKISKFYWSDKNIYCLKITTFFHVSKHVLQSKKLLLFLISKN